MYIITYLQGRYSYITVCNSKKLVVVFLIQAQLKSLVEIHNFH